ncbi:MAG: hypothetical protein RJA99_4341 [Pseudomonadota bacterium]|jgi:hypothetical protein
MTRATLIPFAVAALLAGTAGCASFAPAPTAAAIAADAAAAAAQAPRAEPPVAAAPGPSEPPVAAAPEPSAPSAPTSAATPVPAPATKSAPRASSRSRAGDTSSPARPESSSRGGPSAAGPTVTTFVYSDAPVAVRREAATAEAPRAMDARVPTGFNPYGIAYSPGAYRCELGRSVQVRTVSADLRTTVLRWGRDEFTLRAVDARSGALRYEDPASGLAWIVLRDRSMLLDMREGQRLANACRA